MFVVEKNLSFIAREYPLADYRIGGRRMVTLKRFLHIEGQIIVIYDVFNYE